MLNKIKLAIFILVPVLLGLYVRFDDLKKWLENKSLYFFNGRAIFTGNDAFFFARYAQEFFSGKYKPGELDTLRFVPDFIQYPDPIPFISVLSGFFSKIQGTYIENTSLWLVPILSVLFVIPLVLFFKRIGYPIAGFSGAVLTVISLSYLPRTTIARLDTDSLNLFFPFTIALFLLLTVQSKGKKKYIYSALAGIFLSLYMWWYTKYSLLLGIVAVFIIYLLIEKRLKLKKEDIISAGIFILLSNPLNILKGINEVSGQVYSYIFLAGEKAIKGGFPNIRQYVSELQHYSFDRLGNLITGNEIIFGIGLIGIILLLVNRWKPMILLLPFLALGLIPLIGAMRFAMYLTPFIGIGIGAILDFAVQKIKEKNKEESEKLDFSLSLISSFAILGILLYVNKFSFAFVASPKFPPPLAGDFVSLQEKTEKNAWIWSWWSEGYMIEYYGNRGVFVDPGGDQFTPKTYFVGLTYSINSPQKARNVIFSVASIGLKGINKELKEGKSPEEIKENMEKGIYIKDVKNPIYWLFTIRSLRAFDGINKIGTWDFNMQNGLERQYQYIGTCRQLSQSILGCGRWFIDLKKGEIKSKRRSFVIKDIYLKTSRGQIRRGNYHKNGLNVVIVNSKYGSFGFLMYDQPLYSMFTQMFLLRNYDKNYFELVHDNFPFAVLYKVKK
jgi:dolichyl-diphosphooligosaccharide--protein glycosyltransferase